MAEFSRGTARRKEEKMNTAAKAGAALGIAAALAIATTTPAQAFAPFTYIADCPTNEFNEDATWQQLVIRNYSGSIIQITGWENYPNGQIYNLGTTGASSTGEIT